MKIIYILTRKFQSPSILSKNRGLPTLTILGVTNPSWGESNLLFYNLNFYPHIKFTKKVLLWGDTSPLRAWLSKKNFFQ